MIFGDVQWFQIFKIDRMHFGGRTTWYVRFDTIQCLPMQNHQLSAFRHFHVQQNIFAFLFYALQMEAKDQIVFVMMTHNYDYINRRRTFRHFIILSLSFYHRYISFIGVHRVPTARNAVAVALRMQCASERKNPFFVHYAPYSSYVYINCVRHVATSQA